MLAVFRCSTLWRHKISEDINFCVYVYCTEDRFSLTNKAYAVYYTLIKHDGHLRTRWECRKHESQASVFYISRVFSNDQSVLSQCNTWLRLLHLL